MDANLRARLDRMTAEVGFDPYSDAPPCKTTLADDDLEPSPDSGVNDIP
ncbi:hypothetical protein MTO96_045399, partial [Rhipicephalus appendiculatus]